jgi:hypothetical protein
MVAVWATGRQGRAHAFHHRPVFPMQKREPQMLMKLRGVAFEAVCDIARNPGNAKRGVTVKHGYSRIRNRA